MRLAKPWPRGHHIRSPWGKRVHPITGERRHHRGVDVAYHGEIYAPADGTVVHKGADLNKHTGGGYTLILKHEVPRIFTVYYHLREPSPLLKGTRVRKGEVVGHTGTTGASTGVHLHFETRRNRAWGSDFDPESILSHEHANEGEQRLSDSTPRTRPRRPSRALAALSRSWIGRGAHYLKGRGIW